MLLTHLSRLPGARKLWQRFPLGGVETRIQYGIWPRPHYAQGVYAAADLARRLGQEAITVIEFGVAGGRGLLELESMAAVMEKHFSIRIAVAGFDTGGGLPTPLDYRDLPHVWAPSFYKMDVPALSKRLERASLVLGDVADTIPEFLAGLKAPIGFISFDLDYYSSTKAAFQIFGGVPATRLPRIHCYFDDVYSPEIACHNPWVGEQCAIREFNEEHALQKIAKLPFLRWERPDAAFWHEKMFVFHDFEHPAYNVHIASRGNWQLPL